MSPMPGATGPWVAGPTQAKSFEVLRRKDDLYQLAVVIEYNTQPVTSGRGSAIFLHIWRSPQTATSGCVAVPKADIKRFMRWLNPVFKPVIVLGEQSKGL